MSEAEREAMAWLDVLVGPTGVASSDKSRQHARTIKAMLGEPRMPALTEINMVDHNNVLSVMVRAFNTAPDGDWVVKWTSVYCALRAELSKPATKTVEVWHVEFAGANGSPYIANRITKSDADEYAMKLRHEGATLIKVTGPHSQEVPA